MVMMSQLLKIDVKIFNSLIRLHRRPGISRTTQAQAAEASCPNCGQGLGLRSNLLHFRDQNNAEGTLVLVSTPRRLLSTNASTNTVLSTSKKSRKKKSQKMNQLATEIIEESNLATVSESQAKLRKVKPKELSSYLLKITEASSSIRGLENISVAPGFMSYSTSRTDNPFTSVPFSSSAGSAMTVPAHLNDDLCDHDHHLEKDVEGQNSEDVFIEERLVIANPKSSRNIIPEENDLIDSVELETDELVEINTEKSALTETHSEGGDKSKNSPSDQKSKSKKKSNSSQTRLKSKEREQLAKIKREELERLAKEAGLNKSLVAYLDICVFNKQLNRALLTLNYYRNKSRLNRMSPPVTDLNAFNSLLHAYAERGNIVKVREILKSIQDDGLKPSIQSYAAVLDCLGRLPPTTTNHQRISWFIANLKKEGHDLQDLFNNTVYAGNQREIVLQAVKRFDTGFQPKIKKPSTDYSCGLLKSISNTCQSPIVSPAERLITLHNLRGMAKKQFDMELKGTITIKSVEQKNDLEHLPYYRKLLEETEEKWGVAIKEALNRSFVTLLHQGMKFKTQRIIGLYPFLRVLEPHDYVDIIIQEIRKLAEGSETYSPSVSQLYRELGTKVLSRYQVLYKKEKGILEKVRQLYDDYLEWYLDTSVGTQIPNATGPSYKIRNSRQKWQDLLFDPDNTGPDVDINEKTWPSSVLSSVGRFLYGIIMRDIKINSQTMKLNTKTEHLVPAFYSIFRMQGIHLKEEIKPHPALVKLFQAASKDELTFDTNLVPMVSPPLPWASIKTGGYLLTPAKIVRLPFQAHQQKVLLESCPPENLYPSLDSLNQLSAVPWKINKRLLDTVIEVFNNKGDDSLGIPPPPSECPQPPVMEASMTRQEKLKIHKTRLALKRQKAEMYSLWCDALYRLSLANHFRDDLFWFPHNMDFRGRVYPCPPHLNHLGADMARSILVFAKGKPLGPNGLDWLKIHLVNLTGLKKKESIEGRLNYADERLDDILDSADKPLTGRKWWAESEEPWQTLACCVEIANAIRSGDPASYVSHFPVHQDGSCNGLQHYAALGRDQAGAKSVNLAPSHLPQDVYSAVAMLVEKLRDQDAKNGVKIAQTLEGFVKRKVIKQTVMTTVYGVTRFGARLQIAKQLKDIPDFPKEHVWAASLYLVGKTFDSLQEMFTSTKEIQDWFTECARLISQICGQNVEWVTPLGLPVVQPYFRPNKKSYEPYDPLKVSETHIFDMFERPNVMKQKNAFPPNFIHSLDSSHMMLTSLHSEQTGITFVSVHDCYWTHPCTVEVMNKICREQFVAMHSEPILEDLSKFMVKKYSYKESEFFRDGSVTDASKTRLNHLLTEVPTKGSFDLRSVLKSAFFFS